MGPRAAAVINEAAAELASLRTKLKLQEKRLAVREERVSKREGMVEERLQQLEELSDALATLIEEELSVMREKQVDLAGRELRVRQLEEVFGLDDDAPAERSRSPRTVQLSSVKKQKEQGEKTMSSVAMRSETPTPKAQKHFEGRTSQSPSHVVSYVEELSDSDQSPEREARGLAASKRFARRRMSIPADQHDRMNEVLSDDGDSTTQLDRLVKEGLLAVEDVAAMRAMGLPDKDIIALVHQTNQPGEDDFDDYDDDEEEEDDEEFDYGPPPGGADDDTDEFDSDH